MFYYVFQYATGFMSAVALSQKILHGTDADREAYLGFLKDVYKRQAYIQAKTGNTFKSGDGIVSDDIDKMIERVGNIAQKGMRETDRVILNEMINK